MRSLGSVPALLFASWLSLATTASGATPGEMAAEPDLQLAQQPKELAVTKQGTPDKAEIPSEKFWRC